MRFKFHGSAESAASFSSSFLYQASSCLELLCNYQSISRTVPTALPVSTHKSLFISVKRRAVHFDSDSLCIYCDKSSYFVDN
jgi:hypothetical protein